MISPIFDENAVQVKCEIPNNEDNFFRPGYKISVHEQIKLYQEVHTDAQKTSIGLKLNFQITISVSQLNRIRQKWGFSRRSGRPRRENYAGNVSSNAVVPHTGVNLFVNWIETTGQLTPVFDRLHEIIEHYRQEHPEEYFRLLHARNATVERKWQALLILPLLGINKLSEIDYTESDLQSTLGYHYGSSTLTQYLGELERVGADGMKNELALAANGEICYIDGHMMAFWSRTKMHKGKITMTGRIMPGTKAVLAHDKQGNAIDFECYPPDTHLSRIIDERCSEIAATTGIQRFVIDREVNAVNTARRFIVRDWDLICLLDANEYKGTESFKRDFDGFLEDGSALYWATWNPERVDDPRVFVLVQEEQRMLAYWCTPNLAAQLSAKDVVELYRGRVDIQENGIKHLIAHGALNTNYGIKKIWGQDRAQARAIEELDKKQTKLRAKERNLEGQIILQHEKIENSQNNGHARLLVKRQAILEQYQAKQSEIVNKIAGVEAKKQELGEPKQRADRDLRKQKIMMFRSLWLENALRSFVALISKFLAAPLDLEIALELFFFRTGIMFETEFKVVYYLSDENLSAKYKEILGQLVAGFNAIALVKKGKPLQIKIAASP